MRRKIRLIALVAVGLASGLARADLTVIVNANSPIKALTAKQVAEFYLGRNRSFDHGEYALVIDQGRDTPQRERFFKAVTGMAMPQVNAYWSRLKFTGQIQPPQQIDTESVVIDMVSRNPTAIAYVTGNVVGNPQVKSVLFIRE